MKSVFMGKSAALWLMKNIEHMVIGVNPKQFFTLREGDTTFILQRGSNSFGQFLLVTELKIGGLRRSVIIPEGKAKHGWKAFGLELRKMLEPNQYAFGGSGHLKFIPQAQKRNSVFHPSRSFVETVKGPMQAKDGNHSLHQIKAVGQNNIDVAMGEKQQNRMKEMTAVPLYQARKQVVDGSVGQPGTAAVRGGKGRERSINLGINIGEDLPVQNQIRSPLIFSLNSNKTENGKGRDLRDSRWTGKGLIVEVAENGKRRVSWDKYKGGKTAFKWVPRAVTEKLSVGLGPKQPNTHCEPILGPLSTSPLILETGECSSSHLGPLPSTISPNEIEESPTAFTTGLATPEVVLRSDDDERRLSVKPLHVVSPVGATQTKAEGALSIHRHWVSPVEVSGCTETPLKLVSGLVLTGTAFWVIIRCRVGRFLKERGG